jgi:hypothetical protein
MEKSDEAEDDSWTCIGWSGAEAPPLNKPRASLGHHSNLLPSPLCCGTLPNSVTFLAIHQRPLTTLQLIAMESIETESRSALASGSIGARFISQNAVDEAKERREEEWKAAYER